MQSEQLESGPPTHRTPLRFGTPPWRSRLQRPKDLPHPGQWTGEFCKCICTPVSEAHDMCSQSFRRRQGSEGTSGASRSLLRQVPGCGRCPIARAVVRHLWSGQSLHWQRSTAPRSLLSAALAKEELGIDQIASLLSPTFLLASAPGKWASQGWSLDLAAGGRGSSLGSPRSGGHPHGGERLVKYVAGHVLGHQVSGVLSAENLHKGHRS